MDIPEQLILEVGAAVPQISIFPSIFSFVFQFLTQQSPRSNPGPFLNQLKMSKERIIESLNLESFKFTIGILIERIAEPFSQDRIEKSQFAFVLIWIFNQFHLINFLQYHLRQLSFKFCVKNNLESIKSLLCELKGKSK